MTLRRLLVAREPGCEGCRHLLRDPHRIEAALPGLAVLASAQSSSWDGGGLCQWHDRLTNARQRCAAFATR